MRMLRNERKLTQEEMAEALGTSRSHYANIERGIAVPGRNLLMAAVDALSVSLDWLTSGAGAMQPDRAVARNETEAHLLFAFRSMTPEAAAALLQMALANVRGKSS